MYLSRAGSLFQGKPLWCTLITGVIVFVALKTSKEQCHEDFAVLGQFCAKIITLRINHKQNASVKPRQRYQMNFIREG